MAITLVETPGATNANTYATLAEAEAYVETLIFSDAWAGKTNDQKSAALIQAGRLMGTMNWKGMRTSQFQSMAWPRSESMDLISYRGRALARGIIADWLFDRDGYQIDSSVIPQCIKDAQCAFALSLLDDDRAGDAGGLSPDTLKVGTIQIDSLRRSLIPAVVYDLCGWFLAAAPGVVRMERA